MSRKPQKGYYVRGEFVALGSDRDRELKTDWKGGDTPSRTDQKRQSTELQKLGVSLLGLRPAVSGALPLPDALQDALTEARRITSFEGKRRQIQFIGRLMRQLEPATVDAIRQACADA